MQTYPDMIADIVPLTADDYQYGQDEAEDESQNNKRVIDAR